MAIQFPNFLNAQTYQPDYSSIGDFFENHYKGNQARHQEMLNKIQAEFAQPAAEAALKTSQLGNQKSQLDIDKLSMEIAQQRALEKQLRDALSGNQNVQANPMNPASAGQVPFHAPISGFIPRKEAVARANADQARSDQLGGQPTNLQPQETINPGQQPAPQAESNEIVVSKGSPHLAGVDTMYDSNPVSRAYLEKQGFKKTSQIKFDNKTGKTTIVTKYPSGKVTTQSAGGVSPSEGAPLTNAMITQHQKVIAGVDTALPIIQKILEKKEGLAASIQRYPRKSGYLPGMGYVPGFGSLSSVYENQVNAALDSLMNAYAMPRTNEGIEKIHSQLVIAHNETVAAYKRRLKDLVSDLESRKAYSEKEIKKSNKIQPVDTSVAGSSSNNQNAFSSNEWEEI